MIVAIVAEKGGVGKTMIATNLAAMRASAGSRVLLIDADRQGSATFWTEFRAGRDLPQVETQAMQVEAFRRFISVPECSMTTSWWTWERGMVQTWIPRCGTRTAPWCP